MAKNGRQKASQEFNESNFLFGGKTTFQNAFPQIENIKVTVIEKTGHGQIRRRQYDKTNTGEYSDCTNPICVSGGVSMGDLIRKMVREKKTEGEKSSMCKGYEGSPKGKKNYGPCRHRFKVSALVEYKAEESPEATKTSETTES